MSTPKLDKESESIYEPVNPLPIQQPTEQDKPTDVSPDLDIPSPDELGKPDQEVPQQEGEHGEELSPEKPSGHGGKKQTRFDILKSKADQVKQQIKSVIPVRPKLTPEQMAKMKMAQRNRNKPKRGHKGEGSMEPDEENLESQHGEVESAPAEPLKDVQGQIEVEKKVEEAGPAVVTEDITEKVEETVTEDEASSVHEPEMIKPATTKRKYIRHRRQLPEIPNPITSLLNQVEDFKSRLKRSRTPPGRQANRGKRRRSRSADASSSRATSTEPESIAEDEEKAEEEEEEEKSEKNDQAIQTTAAAVVEVKEAPPPVPVITKPPPTETIPPPPAALPVFVTEPVAPPLPPPRPVSTLNKVQTEEGPESSPSSYQTFPQERPKQKQPQGYVSKFMKEHGLEGPMTPAVVAPSISEEKQLDNHDYETITEGPSKPVRRRIKQPKRPPSPPSSFQYNTIAGNEWRKGYDNSEMGQQQQQLPVPPTRSRRSKEKYGSITDSEAEPISISTQEEETTVPSTSNEPSEASTEVVDISKALVNIEAPTTFPRKKRKGPKCLQEGKKEPSGPRPSNFINIMQGRPLPPPPRPERSRGSLNSLEQSSIEQAFGIRHYAQQQLGLGEGLSPIPSGAVVETAFKYPSVPEQESEPVGEGLNKMESPPKRPERPALPSNQQSKTVEPVAAPRRASEKNMNNIHSSSPEPTSSQIRVAASEGEGITLSNVSLALGRVFLRITSRSLEAMANFIETASSEDPAIAEQQRRNKKILLCILLVLVAGIILVSNQSEEDIYIVPNWELLMPPPDAW